MPLSIDLPLSSPTPEAPFDSFSVQDDVPIATSVPSTTTAPLSPPAGVDGHELSISPGPDASFGTTDQTEDQVQADGPRSDCQDDLELQTALRLSCLPSEIFDEQLAKLNRQKDSAKWTNEYRDKHRKGKLVTDGSWCFYSFEQFEGLAKAVSLTPDSHVDEPIYLTNHGVSLARRFEQHGMEEDSYMSTNTFEKVVSMVPDDHADMAAYLTNLGNSSLRRFERLGKLVDINRSIITLELAVSMIPDGHASPNAEQDTSLKAVLCHTLGEAFLSRFRGSKGIKDLESGISMCQKAVRLLSDDDPVNPKYRVTLAIAHATRFQLKPDANEKDIDLALSILETAVRNHPVDTYCVTNLGGLHMTRSDYFKIKYDNNTHAQEAAKHLARAIHDITTATSYFQAAASVVEEDLTAKFGYNPNPGSFISLATILEGYGESLFKRFHMNRDIKDLTGAISKWQEALRVAFPWVSGNPTMAKKLANALKLRFQLRKDTNDIDRAIDRLRHVLNLIQGAPSTDQQDISTQLAIALSTRYEWLRQENDIEEAISTLQNVISHIPDNDPANDCHRHLADCFLLRFSQRRNEADLWSAIAILANSETMAGRNTMGVAYRHLYENTNNEDDIIKAVCLHKEAIKHGINPPSKETAGCYYNGGMDFQTCFKRHKDLRCLKHSMSYFFWAAWWGRGDETNPAFPVWAISFAASIIDYQRTRNDPSLYCDAGRHSSETLPWFGQERKPAESEETEFALDVLQRVVAGMHFSAIDRFRAAEMKAKLAKNPEDKVKAWSDILDILPTIISPAASVADRYRHITEIGTAIREAATAAISFDMLDESVALLEQGRSIVWNQLFAMRMPVDRLEGIPQERVQEYKKLANSLQCAVPSVREDERVIGIAHTSVGLREVEFNLSEAQMQPDYHSDAEQMDELLTQFKDISGTRRFSLPSLCLPLCDIVKKGYIVLLNVCRSGCHALLLTPRDTFVQPVGLDATIEDVESWRKELQEAIAPFDILRQREATTNQDVGGLRLGTLLQEKHCDPEEVIKGILEKLWHNVVKPVLDGLNIKKRMDSEIRRVWWCPTGPLSFLPIHAAGLYDSPDAPKLSDYVVSSYTPSLAALSEKNRPRCHPTDEWNVAVRKLVTVSQPGLPGAGLELDCIKNHLPKDNFHLTRLDERAATKETVAKALKDHSWSHFACHGQQDRTNPTNSALLLSGHSRLTIQDTIQLDLQHSEFAFLSACETASGDPTLQDEAVHLAAGMMLAGYRGVIGTMWRISDKDTPPIAAAVYDRLFANTLPDAGQAAEALHWAIMKYRHELKFVSWVPFIHFGV